MSTLTSYDSSVVSGLSIKYLSTYKGGDVEYDTSFLDDTGQDYIVKTYEILLSPISDGLISFSGSQSDFVSTFYTAPTTPSRNVAINLTGANTDQISAYGTGNHYSFILTGNQNGKFYGHSNDDKNIVFIDVSPNSTNSSTRSYELQNTTFILNGPYSVQAFILDYGGNTIWSGDKPLSIDLQDTSTLSLPLPSDDYPGNAFQAPELSNNTIIAAGKAEGNITIDRFPDAKLDNRTITIVLDTINTSNTAYTINQTADVETNLFQKNGSLTFTGNHTNIVINSSSLSNTYLSATLLGGDTVWNGNGYASIVQGWGSNTIVTTGEGNLSITGKTQLPSGNDTSSTNLKNELQIINFGNGTGDVSYNQDQENVTISGLKNHLNAVLGKGTATIDVGNFSGTSSSAYTIVTGQGDLVLEHFTPQTTQSKNNIFLASNQNIVSTQYVSGNTVFHLNTGNTVTITQNDVSQQNIFS